MKLRLRTLFTLVLFMFCACSSAQETNAREEFIQSGIMAIIDKGHYQPHAVNDELSERVFGLFLKNLDYGKRFFLQSDVDSLKAIYYHSIDDEINGNGNRLEFYTAVRDLFLKRLGQVEKFYGPCLDQPFDYQRSETIETDFDKRQWPKDMNDLKDQWRKMLKYQTLSRYFDEAENITKDGATPDYLPGGVMKPEWEQKARDAVRKNNANFLKRERELKEDDYFALYMNAIIASFDPHSGYMTEQDRKQFDIDMSGKLEGIGAKLSEEDGYCKISEIIPGGPAWKEGHLKAGDIILKVAQGKGEFEDIVDMSVDDSVQKIRGKKGTEVRLLVKKTSGDIITVTLVRDVVEIEETFAKAAVIKDKKNDMKYGYILLPKFYRDFSNANARNSTDDVRKAIQSLTQENIDGLILDLRENGGGALEDAEGIAGLFLTGGPVVQVKDGNGRVQVYRDTDSRSYYDGPLVVLVNDGSASASEIAAAALQDYHRAIIVGTSAQTFGKGTVQNVPQLDQFLPNKQFRHLGSLRMTIQKFYRINGGSTQFKGVRPDVRLPSVDDYLKIGETDYDYPMPWDSIRTSNFTPFRSGYNTAALRLASGDRIAHSNAFQLVQAQYTKYKQRHDESLVDIGLNAQLEQRKELRQDSNTLKDNLPEMSYVNVKVLDDDINHGKSSDKLRKDWISSIRKDIYLEEASNVLKDLAKQMKAKKD